MTSRRVPWWGWLLVAAPWAAGLGWAVVVVIIGQADREVVIRGPATVAAIVAGSVLTAVAAALVVTFRQPWPGTDHLGRPALPDPQEGPVRGSPSLLNRLDREAVGRLGSVRDLLASVRAAAERGVIAPADVTALERAASEVDDLSTLLAELRTLTDLEEGPSDPVPVDVDAVLADVAALVTASPGLGGRRLVRPDGETNAPTTAPALGERDLLFLALHKIVLNALAFSRPGSTITMRASERGAEVLVEISDTGPGIPADEMPAVWEPFTRGRRAEHTGGSGLGLTLAKAAVERHGGTIRVRSREGLGTVVAVALPAARRSR